MWCVQVREMKRIHYYREIRRAQFKVTDKSDVYLFLTNKNELLCKIIESFIWFTLFRNQPNANDKNRKQNSINYHFISISVYRRVCARVQIALNEIQQFFFRVHVHSPGRNNYRGNIHTHTHTTAHKLVNNVNK